ncbi:hypothetical protein D1AOALGA4SA_10932 [Olavius algarvensis Delta 1 endosymbiont]|nr:hypothetical protein D1AOALGA4SA_10932 [Olavius algarvensis Delta 1 endosymbiont]
MRIFTFMRPLYSVVSDRPPFGSDFLASPVTSDAPHPKSIDS